MCLKILIRTFVLKIIATYLKILNSEFRPETFSKQKSFTKNCNFSFLRVFSEFRSKMEHIYCGIKFPAPRNFERVRVDNVNFNENSAALKERILNEVLKTKDEISLVYLGNILADDEPICKQKNIRSGSTIHVLKKPKEEEIKTYTKFTEADVSRVVTLYRSLNSGNFHVR